MLCIDKNEKVYASGARCFIQNKKNKRERERKIELRYSER